MSNTTRRPLPPALKALQSTLGALPPEESSDGETESVDVRDFTVRALFLVESKV